MLVDSHAHLYKEYYDNIDDVCINALNNGVKKIINCSTNFDNMEEVKKLSSNDLLYYTYGIHPEEIDKVVNYRKKFEEEVLKSLNDNKFLGIGEIGLDYHYNNLNKLKQQELFDFQLYIASKYNLPVIIHSREATKDTIDLLKKYNLKGIVHCFSGSLETAREYIKLGYKIGIGGIVTFKNCNLKEYIKEIGLENIVLETDSPYMTPHPFRGEKNEPKNIKNIAIFLGEIFNKSVEEIAKITYVNILTIFDFKA